MGQSTWPVSAYLCRIKIVHNLAWAHSSLVSARLLHHHNQESDYSDDFTEQLQTSIASTVTESDSVSVSHTADTASTDQQAKSTHHLQSSVRQTLSTIINYTYLITDRNFTKKSLHSLQQQLQQFHHWADHAAGRLCFRQSRKLVNSRLINWCVAVGIWFHSTAVVYRWVSSFLTAHQHIIGQYSIQGAL